MSGRWKITMRCEWGDDNYTALTLDYSDDCSADELVSEMLRHGGDLTGHPNDAVRTIITIEFESAVA